MTKIIMTGKDIDPEITYELCISLQNIFEGEDSINVIAALAYSLAQVYVSDVAMTPDEYFEQINKISKSAIEKLK